MNTPEPTNRRPVTSISAVESDGTLVETVFLPKAGRTAFAIASKGNIQIANTWAARDTEYVPVRPTNSLIAHAAIVLPSTPAEYESTTTLLADIAGYINRYVSLPDQAVDLATAYVLLSWVYDAFNELPYLRFRGDYGTGKTRALFVVGSLCYKAFFASGASTVSPIFHTLDSFKGTLVIDEADFRFTDEKAELVKILNNGNVKGFPVLRTQVTPRKEFDPRAFTIFGPKIVGMRRFYEDRALETRFLTVEMEPGQAQGVPINLPESQKEEALLLRNKLLMYRFRNRLTVTLKPDLADPRLEPRMNQILLPLLSVLPTEEVRAPVRQAAAALQARVLSERSVSTEAQLLSIVSGLLRERTTGTISLADLAGAFVREHASEYQRPITNRWLGSILRRMGILLYKSNGIVVLVPGQNERVDALCARYGIENPPSDLDTAAAGAG